MRAGYHIVVGWVAYHFAIEWAGYTTWEDGMGNGTPQHHLDYSGPPHRVEGPCDEVVVLNGAEKPASGPTVKAWCRGLMMTRGWG